jgi:sugar lactone lactonase YvrE
MKSTTLLLALAACLAASSARAQFASFLPPADRVLGAPDFTTVGSGAATASTISIPTGLAVDPVSGKLFVADSGNHRILRFANAAALANGASAEAVIGQSDFTTGTAGLPGAGGLNQPFELHVDGSGRLWVSDRNNNRVLMYTGASSLPATGATPTLVLGQSGFNGFNPGTSATQMNEPVDVFVDAADNLWVVDYDNSRVLKFANVSSLSNGAAATTVLGQSSFFTSTPGTSASTMRNPGGLVVDGTGRLWVTDYFNHRILRFDNAASLTDGAEANGVLGQPDFATSTPNTTAQGMRFPATPTIGSDGTLYVADFENRRVLIFKNPATKANGAAADGVIGQPTFTTGLGFTTNRQISRPYGLALNPSGSLWVSDYGNNRVLRFSPDSAAVPPSVVGRVPKTTSSGKLTIKGTATDPSGIAQVRFRVGKGAFKTATGTTAWSLKAKLKPGKNKIEIVAVDAVGNVSPAKKVKVKRE